MTIAMQTFLVSRYVQHTIAIFKPTLIKTLPTEPFLAWERKDVTIINWIKHWTAFWKFIWIIVKRWDHNAIFQVHTTQLAPLHASVKFSRGATLYKNLLLLTAILISKQSLFVSFHSHMWTKTDVFKHSDRLVVKVLQEKCCKG